MPQLTKQPPNEIFIPIDKEVDEFNTYLQSMERVILSARYGDGKSTFLGQFSEKFKEQYIFFTIYPLNYQVAENKDIFEYIKRDLLLQILSWHEFKEEEFNKIMMIWGYCQTHKLAIFDDILNSIPNFNIAGLGTDTLKEPIAYLLKNIEKFRDYETKIKELSESNQAETFINEFDNYKGSIYEFDVISQTICKIVQQIKAREENKNKKVVLVVEDLDRIDPAHIFRILNILSAHIERKRPGLIEWKAVKGSNKFDFDTILLVCDLNNIKSIFHHFYGENTDFKGYISKFSSQLPFTYSLREKYMEFIFSKLDADLLKHEKVKSVLTDLIIDKSISKTKENPISLRGISNNLEGYIHLILKEEIQLGKNLHFIRDNDFIKVLALLKAFEIDFPHFEKIATDYKNELIELIGICWILPCNSKKYNCVLQEKENSIVITNNSIVRSSQKTLSCKLYGGIGVVRQIGFNAENLETPSFFQPNIIEDLPIIVTEMKKYIINQPPTNP